MKPQRRRSAPATNEPVMLHLMALVDASPMNMKDVGKKSGVHWRTINNWRYAVNGAAVTNLRAVANVFGYEIALVKKDDPNV